jgi:hypothetical protein
MSSSQTCAVPEWLSWANMLAACRRASAGKRTRPSVARFLLQQEDELVRLRAELLEGTWKPSPPTTRMVFEPKPRAIAVAPFRDRVAHHVLCAAMPQAPWGGVKGTGLGVTSSKYILHELTHPKLILVDANKARELWWYPYNDRLHKILDAMIDAAGGKLHRMASALRNMIKRWEA